MRRDLRVGTVPDELSRRARHAGRVLRGLAWVAGAQVGLHLTRAVVAIVIARLLTPDEYGLAALAIVFSSLVMVFSDLALGAALIQRKDLSEEDRDTAFWVTVASGILFTGLGVLLVGTDRVALRRAGREAAAGRALRELLRSPRSARPSVPDDARHGLPPLEMLAWPAPSAARSSASCWRRGRRRVGDSSCSRSPPPSLTTALVWCAPTGIRASFSRSASLRDLGGVQHLHARPADPLLPAGERRSLPDRPLPRHGRARRLRRGLQHDARAGEQDRRPAPARVLAGVLAAPGRAGADRRDVGARRCG